MASTQTSLEARVKQNENDIATLNTSLNGIQFRINEETGKGEYKAVGADTWSPFNSVLNKAEFVTKTLHQSECTYKLTGSDKKRGSATIVQSITADKDYMFLIINTYSCYGTDWRNIRGSHSISVSPTLAQYKTSSDSGNNTWLYSGISAGTEIEVTATFSDTSDSESTCKGRLTVTGFN